MVEVFITIFNGEFRLFCCNRVLNSWIFCYEIRYLFLGVLDEREMMFSFFYKIVGDN